MRWSIALVDEEKARIKAELDAAKAGLTPKRHLQGILRRIEELEDDASSRGQLRRFVYVVSSLVHHARHGGLSRSQIRRAAELATTILQIHGVRSGTSRLAFLYGELHLVLSQIHRKVGRHWHAAWEHQHALYTARRSLPGGEEFQSLAMGNRALRLGHATLAIRHLTAAEAGGLADTDMEKARLARLKALRLSGKPEEARRLLVRTERELPLNAEGRRELAWEALCLETQATGDASAMLRAVERDGSHHAAIFLLEASLWVKSLAEREAMERLIRVKTMGKRPDLKPQAFGFFFELAGTLDRCYDLETPLPHRIRRLGDALARTTLLTTVDKELLAWAAAARFLARSHAHSHAALALSEYVGLSLRLSDGADRDVLGLMRDILDREWFDQEPGAA